MQNEIATRIKKFLSEIPKCAQRRRSAYFLRDSVKEIIRLQAEVDRTKDDAELLDWLADPANEIGNVQLPLECVVNNIDSLRGAIRDSIELGKAKRGQL